MAKWRYYKGQDFERTTCRYLSLWLSKGTNANLLWRTAASGGRATQLRKSGVILSAHAGDIAAIDPEAEAFIRTFFIECKNLATLRLDGLFYELQGELGHMWTKCCQQAADFRKVPLLICKEKHKPELLCCPLWFDIFSDSLCIAKFYLRNLSIYPLKSLELLDVQAFIHGGQSDACAHYGGPTPDEPTSGRVPVGVLPVAVNPRVRRPANTGGPRRRERLSS